MSSPTPPPSPSPPPWLPFRPQFSMRTVLVVVTATAVVLGLWSWLAYSLPIAMLLLVRSAQVAVVAFLLQGALVARGRTQVICQGALVGAIMGLIVSPSTLASATAFFSLFTMILYVVVGGWTGDRARGWWLAAVPREAKESDLPKS